MCIVQSNATTANRKDNGKRHSHAISIWKRTFVMPKLDSPIHINMNTHRWIILLFKYKRKMPEPKMCPIESDKTKDGQITINSNRTDRPSDHPTHRTYVSIQLSRGYYKYGDVPGLNRRRRIKITSWAVLLDGFGQKRAVHKHSDTLSHFWMEIH